MTPVAGNGTARPDRRTALVVGLCLAAITFDGYDLIVYGSAVPALLHYQPWALDAQQVGAIGSAALIGLFIGAIAAGAITDRFGRRRTIIGCITLFSLAMLACAAAPSAEFFAVARIIAGIGIGGVTPPAVALTVETVRSRRRSTLSAVMLSGYPLGGILSSVLALVLLEPFGFRILFALGALPLLLFVPAALRWLPESPSFAPSNRGKRASRGAGLGMTVRAFRGRHGVALLLLAVANFASMLIIYGLSAWLPQLMRSAGYALGPALTFLLVLNIGAIVGGVAASAWADRIGPRTATTATFALGAVTIFALSRAALPTPLLYLLILVAGAGTTGTQIVLFSYVADRFPHQVRGIAVGVSSGIGRLGAVVGPLLGGYLIAQHAKLTTDFLIFAAVAAAGAIASLLVPRRTPARQQVTTPDERGASGPNEATEPPTAGHSSRSGVMFASGSTEQAAGEETPQE